MPAARAPGVPAGAQGRLRAALGATSQQAPLQLTGWLHLFLQAANRLLTLLAQLQALPAPRMPLWLGVIQSLLWMQVLPSPSKHVAAQRAA